MRPPPPHLGSIRADFKANGFKTRFCPPHRRSSAAGGLLAASVSGCSCHSRRLCPLPPAVPCPLSNKCEELKQLPCAVSVAVCSCCALRIPLGLGIELPPFFPAKNPAAEAVVPKLYCSKKDAPRVPVLCTAGAMLMQLSLRSSGGQNPSSRGRSGRAGPRPPRPPARSPCGLSALLGQRERGQSHPGPGLGCALWGSPGAAHPVRPVGPWYLRTCGVGSGR